MTKIRGLHRRRIQTHLFQRRWVRIRRTVQEQFEVWMATKTELCKSNRILEILYSITYILHNIHNILWHTMTLSRFSFQIHLYHITSKWRASSINPLSFTHRGPSSRCTISRDFQTNRQLEIWPNQWVLDRLEKNSRGSQPPCKHPARFHASKPSQTARPLTCKTIEYVTPFFRTWEKLPEHSYCVTHNM